MSVEDAVERLLNVSDNNPVKLGPLDMVSMKEVVFVTESLWDVEDFDHDFVGVNSFVNEVESLPLFVNLAEDVIDQECGSLVEMLGEFFVLVWG